MGQKWARAGSRAQSCKRLIYAVCYDLSDLSVLLVFHHLLLVYQPARR